MIVPQQNLTQALAEQLGGTVDNLVPIQRGAAHRMFTARWQQPDQPPDSAAMPIVIRFFHGPRAIEDADAEAAALRELGRTGYPVPELFLLNDDDSIDGAPLIVMQELPGQTLTQAALANPERIPQWLDRASDLLLRLHGVNWQNGYAALKPVLPPLDFAERQVRWWARQASTVAAGDLDEGFGWLRAHLYRTRSATNQALLHRDFHPDNILVIGDRISGVVDWGELTIGDPALDVGWSRLVLTTEANADLGDRFAEAYMRRNPSVGATLPFWEVFGAVKRLTTIAMIKANKSERLAMWADAPDLVRQVGREDAVRSFLTARIAVDDADK